MSDEKTQGSGARPPIDAPGENTVQVTFLPESKTVRVRTRQAALPGSRQAAIAARCRPELWHHLDHACGGNCACTTCHVWVKKGKELSQPDGRRRSRQLDMAADLQLELAPRMPARHREARRSRRRNSGVESQLRF